MQRWIYGDWATTGVLSLRPRRLIRRPFAVRRHAADTLGAAKCRRCLLPIPLSRMGMFWNLCRNARLPKDEIFSHTAT